MPDPSRHPFVSSASRTAVHEGGPPTRETTPVYVWAFLGALCFSLFSGYTDLVGLPVPVDRLLFAGAVVLLLLDPTTERLRRHGSYAAMAAVIAWTAWSALGAGTLLEPKGMFALLDRIIVPFAMFCLGPLVFSTPWRRLLLLRTVALMSLYLAVTGVFELFGPSALVWPRYIMDPEIGILFGRARGPFVSAEPNGMVMALGLGMCLLLWRLDRGLWRVLALVSGTLSLLGVILCLTRSIWIATILGALTVALLVPRARRILPVAVAGLVLLAGLVLAALPQVAAALDERINMKSSIYDRQNTNEAALRIIAERPIDGVGWQKFTTVVTEYVRQSPEYPLSNINIEVHNVFLSRAAETGVLGAILWGLAVLFGPVAIAFGLRRQRPGSEMYGWTLLLIAALYVWFVPTMVSPNPYPLPNNLVWLIAGIAGRDVLVAGAAGGRRREPASA